MKILKGMLKNIIPLIIMIFFLSTTIVLWRLHKSEMEKQAALESTIATQSMTIEAMQENNTEENEDVPFIHEASQPVITATMIQTQLVEVAELITSEYLYTTAGNYERTNQATIIKWDVDIPLTKKHFIVGFDGIIKAGIDLNQVAIDIDEDKRAITIGLPSSYISSHEVIADSLVIYDEEDGLFNKITIDDYAEFEKDRKDAMEQAAINYGLLEKADEEAKRIIKLSLSSIPGMDTYTLIVR